MCSLPVSGIGASTVHVQAGIKWLWFFLLLFSAISDYLFADIYVNGVDSDAKVMICVTSV